MRQSFQLEGMCNKYKGNINPFKIDLIKQASLKSHSSRHKIPDSQKKEKPRNSSAKSRKTRCDRGKPKKAIAAILSGYPVSNEESKQIMRNMD